jgi:hypothetical protein
MQTSTRHFGFYFDCVAAESTSAATRRLYEISLSAEVESWLNRLNNQVPRDAVTWILPDVPHVQVFSSR